MHLNPNLITTEQPQKHPKPCVTKTATSQRTRQKNSRERGQVGVLLTPRIARVDLAQYRRPSGVDRCISLCRCGGSAVFRLAAQLAGIKRRFILSLNDNSEIRRIFAGFVIEGVEMTC